MKNDVIGTFAILLIGAAFLFFAKSYNGGEFWMPEASQSLSLEEWFRFDTSDEGTATSSSKSTVAAESRAAESFSESLAAEMLVVNEATPEPVLSSTPLPLTPLVTEKIKAEKTTAPFPYLLGAVQKKYAKTAQIQSLVGGIFMWPEGNQGKNASVYSYVTGAQGLTIESKFDLTGKELKKQRNFLTSSLKKIGFKKMKNMEGKCQTTETVGFNECLDYYERGNEKCMSVLVMTPIDPRDKVALEDRLVQLKIWCGKTK